MSSRAEIRGLPWIAGVVVSAVMVGALVLLLRVPSPPIGGAAGAAPEFGMLAFESWSNLGTEDESTPLRDPVPLYLPTMLNSGQAQALATRGHREPVAAFSAFPAKLNFGELDLRVEFPSAVEPPANAVQAFDADQGAKAYRYIGRRDPKYAPASPRLGALQVARADTGNVVLQAKLDGIETSPPAVDWAPVELVAAVNSGGLVGLPAIVTSSGVAAFDGWVVRFLASDYRIGERLAPGIYRISLGP